MAKERLKKTLKVALFGGFAVANLGLIADGLYAAIPKRNIRFTESGVSWTYLEKRKAIFRNSYCMISLSNGELTNSLTDEKCDGSVNSYNSTNIKNGKKISEVYTWRTEETELEFLGHDEFFSMANGYFKTGDK